MPVALAVTGEPIVNEVPAAKLMSVDDASVVPGLIVWLPCLTSINALPVYVCMVIRIELLPLLMVSEFGLSRTNVPRTLLRSLIRTVWLGISAPVKGPFTG